MIMIFIHSYLSTLSWIGFINLDGKVFDTKHPQIQHFPNNLPTLGRRKIAFLINIAEMFKCDSKTILFKQVKLRQVAIA